MKMVVDKGKKQKVEEENNAPAEHIDGDLVLSVEKLQEIQDQLEKINEEVSEKVIEIEQKYNEIRKPIYHKRNDLVKSIPDFWLTAFINHPALGALLTEEDEKVFKYLSSIEVEDAKDVKYGYTITFNFNVNPYFENSKLTKTVTFTEDESIDTTGTPIKWKEGMDIVNGVVKIKKGNKRSRAEESFFAWFKDTHQNDEDLMELHDEVAEIIKEDLWTNPLHFFNNEVDFDEEESEDEENASDDSGDDDDDDDDDEEGEDDE